MKQKHYMDIQRLQIKYEDCFKKGEQIVVEEKIDGANSAFSYVPATNTIVAFSRRQQLSEINTLNGFWEWTQRLPIQAVAIATNYGRYVLFGEWSAKHTISYPEMYTKKFFMYDVWDTEEEKWLPFEDVLAIYNGLSSQVMKAMETIYFAPVFYTGPFISWEHLYNMVGTSNLEASPLGEGIVIKSQDRLNDSNTRKPFYLKLVAEKFSEVHKDHKKPIDPEELKKKEALRNYAATVVTRRRIEKLLEKLIEDQIIPCNWNETNMGTIAKNINRLAYEDCLKEEPETVQAIEGFGKICGGLTMEHVREILKERTEVKI